MASGSFSSSIYNNHFTLRCDWASTASVATNKSSVTVTCYLVLDKYGSLSIGSRTVTVVINGVTKTFTASSINKSGPTTITLGTTEAVDVTHNSDGKKSIEIGVNFPIKATLSGTYYASINANGTAVLDDIPRQATITSAPNFNDTQNPTISYSNPAGNAVEKLQACISLTGSSADIVYRDIPKTGTSYTFNLTEAERNVLRQATTGKTRTVRFYVATTIGGTIYRNYKEVTFTVTNANPTFSCAYLDTNSTTVGITGNNQYIIRNKSTLRVNITNASALKYATLSSAKVTINGTTYTGTFSGGSSTINVGVLNVSSNVSASVVVTDSRGYTTTKTLTIQVYDWVNPSAIISMARESNFYAQTKITVDGSVSSLGGKNTMTIRYRRKKVSATSWSSWTTLQDNVTATFTADNNFEWDVQVQITDKIGSTTYNLKLGRGIPLIFFDMLKNSTGINCFPVGDETLEVNGEDILSKFTGIGGIAKTVTGNWNTACGTLSGFYMGNGLSNSPSGPTVDNWWWVVHIAHNDKYQKQIAYSFLDDKASYTRLMNNGTWSAWQDNRILNRQSTNATQYTLSTNSGEVVYLWASADMTVTIPSGLPIGWCCTICCGYYLPTIVTTGSDVLNVTGASGQLASVRARKRYSQVCIHKIGSSQFSVEMEDYHGNTLTFTNWRNLHTYRTDSNLLYVYCNGVIRDVPSATNIYSSGTVILRAVCPTNSAIVYPELTLTPTGVYQRDDGLEITFNRSDVSAVPSGAGLIVLDGTLNLI